MKMTKQGIIREAIEVLGHKASNAEIKNYAKKKFDIEVRPKDIWAQCGSEKLRRFNDVTYAELQRVEKDSKKYGSLSKLIRVAKCAYSMKKEM